jgi:hypothetical protein
VQLLWVYHDSAAEFVTSARSVADLLTFPTLYVALELLGVVPLENYLLK